LVVQRLEKEAVSRQAEHDAESHLSARKPEIRG
jgi:hypothetical protein